MSIDIKTLLPKVQKRILSDINELDKNSEELNQNGIYWHIDESNIGKIWVVITGQEDTPYAFAPFFFEFAYPENYPMVPPKGTFCTRDGHTRFNPNLYVDGKICLSILGTWQGPSWTPVMTTKYIIMSIIALVMTNEPIKNEPGWENANPIDIEEYNAVVEYRSLQHGIIDQLNNCHLLFKPMLDKMVDRFRRDYLKIMEKIEKNILKYNGRTVKPRYGAEWLLNYARCKEMMIELGGKFGVKSVPILAEIPDPMIEEDKKKTKESANMYDVGYEMEFDGLKFVVKENKSGKKYWRRI